MAKFDLIGGLVQDKRGALKTLHSQVSIESCSKTDGKVKVKKRRSSETDLDTSEKRADWLTRGFHFFLD
jgi:hypothetical protein